MTDVDSAPPAGSPDAADPESAARLAIIRDAGLSVDDPETIPNLHHPIPVGMEPVRLVRDYDTSRTTGRKVRCSACAHHQHHNRGFVAEMPDGRPALIGINCGEERFGEGEWDRMRSDLRREQDDVYYAARVLPAIEQIKTSYDRAVALKNPVRTFETRWGETRRSVPKLFALLQIACAKNEGYLDRYVTRTVQSIGRDGRMVQKEEIETKRLGRVPAPGAFIARPATSGLDAAIGTLRTAKLKFESGADTKSRREAFAELARGRRIVEDLAAQLRGYVRNSETEWWAQAVRFCLDEGVMTRLSLAHRTLFGSADGVHVFEVAIPRFAPADVERAEDMLSAWPLGA